MKLKDEFNRTQGKKWLVPWSDDKEIKYQSTYIHFLESKIEQLTIPDITERTLTDYDIGLINDYGGGDISWWMDYIRSEVDAANEHWREQLKDE